MNRRDILIVILIASLGVGGVMWFLANFEPATEEVWVGFRGEAQRNPFLAAQRLIERMGGSATFELRQYEDLRNLQPGAVLVMPSSRQSISTSLRANVVDWVRSGGYLVIEAEHPVVPDPLLDTFGVQRVEDQYNTGTGSKSARGSAETTRPADNVDRNSLDLTVVRLPQSRLSSLVWMEAGFSLVSERAWLRAGTQYAANMLLQDEGDGIVAIVSDLGFATNLEIGELDHAQFIIELTRLTGQSGPVLFFNNPGQPSLIKWLRTYAWAPILAGGIALFLWLWRVGPRFGPVAPDAPRDRRRLLDHLRASGRFLWARGQGSRLLEVSREACLRQISRAFPEFETSSASAKASRLRRSFGINEEQAQRILTPQSSDRMLHFMDTIRLYQLIHARLAQHQVNEQ